MNIEIESQPPGGAESSDRGLGHRDPFTGGWLFTKLGAAYLGRHTAPNGSSVALK